MILVTISLANITRNTNTEEQRCIKALTRLLSREKDENTESITLLSGSNHNVKQTFQKRFFIIMKNNKDKIYSSQMLKDWLHSFGDFYKEVQPRRHQMAYKRYEPVTTSTRQFNAVLK